MDNHEAVWLLQSILSYVAHQHKTFAVLFDVAHSIHSNFGANILLYDFLLALQRISDTGFDASFVQSFFSVTMPTQFSMVIKQKVGYYDEPSVACVGTC